MASRIWLSGCFGNYSFSVDTRSGSFLRHVLLTGLGIIFFYAMAAQAQAAIVYMQQNYAVPPNQQSTVAVTLRTPSRPGISISWS
jgi:hypothetical protein